MTKIDSKVHVNNQCLIAVLQAWMQYNSDLPLMNCYCRPDIGNIFVGADLV